MALELLIAGGGIGGLAAALACSGAGRHVRVFEQAGAFSEVGAGIQLGPNATRVLRHWGVEQPLRDIAATPSYLRIRDASSGDEVARMPLGEDFVARYGSPYFTIHRADLQSLLLHAAHDAGVETVLDTRVVEATEHGEKVRAQTSAAITEEADALVAADGVWSRLRAIVAGPGDARLTGHLAYRALARSAELPKGVRSGDVTVWLGPRMHLVAYPVRQGEQFNVVAIVEAANRGVPQDWDQSGTGAELLQAMGPVAVALRSLLEAMPGWRLWALHDRDPVRSAAEMARGRIALLGDAAHPMLPYLAQGAGMAIEDAAELAANLRDVGNAGVPAALARYAQRRWQRCAQVQSHARRNALIFHADGVVRWGRDMSLRLLGHRLLDQPWLYR